MKNLAAMTPVEVDTCIADIVRRYWEHRAPADALDALMAKCEQTISHPGYTPGQIERAKNRLTEYAEQRAAIVSAAHEILAETDPYEAEFHRRGGWPRFYLVTSSDGHVHSSGRCQSFRVTTRCAILVEYSGRTEAEALQALGTSGEVLCTICFPSAPVAWTVRRPADGECPGSGTYDYPADTARLGFTAGNYGVCTHCGQRVTVPGNSRKLRKHTK